MKRYLLIFGLFIFVCFCKNAVVLCSPQASIDALIIENREKLEQATNDGDRERLYEARQLFERMLTMKQKEFLVHYYIALASQNLYYLIYDNEEQKAELIKNAIEHLELSIKSNKKFAESWILLANMYGLKIGVDSKNTISLSKKQKKALRTALKLEPENPRRFLVSGRSAYFTPKAFGGGMEKAEKDLLQALELFSSYVAKSKAYPIWGHDETYVWLGQIAVKQKKFKAAEEYYQQALKLNPNYNWVSNYLMPQLKEKMASGADS